MGHARIGKVRFKDSATVIPLRKGADVRNDRKMNFVNHAGCCIDSYAAKRGEFPDAMVLVLCGVKQDSEAFWIVRGDSEGGGASVLALAQATIQREISER